MKSGKLFGIGVGPGDPELITVKGARLLKDCSHLFVPKAKVESESLALDIAKGYLSEKTEIHKLIFPMLTDKKELERCWNESACRIAEILKKGEDACFLTLGDAMLYSTYIYLIRALMEVLPGVEVETVPGVTSFSAVAALTNFPVGEGKEPVTIIPAADDLESIRKAVKNKGTVVLMKIGKRLQGILNILEDEKVIDDAAFVAYAGQGKERVETDLRKLQSEKPETSYLSTILVRIRA